MKNMKFYMTLMKSPTFFLREIREKAKGVARMTDASTSHRGPLNYKSRTKSGKTELPFNPAIPLLGLYPQNPESPIQKNQCTPIFIEALSTIVKC